MSSSFTLRHLALACALTVSATPTIAEPVSDLSSLDRICHDYADRDQRRQMWAIFEALNEDTRGLPVSATFGDALHALRAGRHREGVLLLAAASFTDSSDSWQRRAASGARLLLEQTPTEVNREVFPDAVRM